ncbi:HK97 family phage major capsid protein [Clostridium sporogenes]|uniref:phage major capsid protein n=1 Tax=Clostridium botulinum TaxID=1491 RepID=UPI000717875B|nr:phage major capsid protein [Clostridium botulinum]KRU24120.1 HK97 family phage major capsid protein [Clostridium sporogenes]KRU25511.1 HK97 family phage major capsid protein [Clostridium sporogenes]KRU35106.1 HK97 family phage major capsid protein [Clostridium sporogenes]KRU42120.1 HK97 family phage major capsid protein [Clostridium sporogenes]MBZ1328009.1 phage major capsid protein [Clostridium botulinum]
MLNTRIYNQAFWSKMRGTLVNHDDLKEGQIDGGYQLPNDSLDKFYKALERDNLFRRLATVLSLTNLEGTVHATTSTGSAGVVEEGNIIPEDGDKFTQFPVRSYKIASIAKLKESFVSDNDFNLEKYLTTDFARRFGRAEENLFINGHGVTNQTGILSVSESVNAKETNTLSYDEIVELYFSIEAEYRKDAVFIMNDETAFYLRTLKDDDGNYLWNSNNDTIFGKEVITSPYMPSIESGKQLIIFGDLSFYWVIERKPLAIQVLSELYKNQGQVGFIGYERVDGKLIRPEAVKTIKMA